MTVLHLGKAVKDDDGAKADTKVLPLPLDVVVVAAARRRVMAMLRLSNFMLFLFVLFLFSSLVLCCAVLRMQYGVVVAVEWMLVVDVLRINYVAGTLLL